MTPDGTWAHFGEALVRELAELPEDSFLVFKDPAHMERVTQFWQSADDLRAEVAGPSVLTEQDRKVLAAAGFSPPGDFNVDGGNWWRTVPAPVTADGYRSMAESAVTVLQEVQRISDPGALTYHAWGYTTGHRLLDLPGPVPDQAKYDKS